jgi:hypothetical protein
MATNSATSEREDGTAELEFDNAQVSDLLSEEETRVTLSRLRKPVRVAVFLIVVAVLIAASFVAGRFVQAPSSAAVQAAQETIPVTVRVEKRVVAEQFEVAATVTAGPTVSLTPLLSVSVDSASTSGASEAGGSSTPGQGGESAIGSNSSEPGTPSGNVAGMNSQNSPQHVPTSERAVVTGTAVQIGQTISYGQLLGEVSGRPVFAAPPSLPLYRDLVQGSEGEDVLGLQHLLVNLGYAGVQATGNLDVSSFNALERFYQNNGYALPILGANTKGLSWREFLPVANDTSIVTNVAPVGTVLEGEASFITVKTSPDVISARVSVGDADKLKVGQALFVTKGTSAPVETTVTAISDFTVDEATQWSGRTVTAALPLDLNGAAESEPLRLSSSVQPAPGIALPVIAVRQDSSGPYVVLATGQSDAAETETEAAAEQRVPVTVIAQSGGWVAIEPVDTLPVGTQLQVPA